MSVIFVTPIRVVPQSARWLLANDRKEEAIALLRKAALVNGRVLPPTVQVCLIPLCTEIYFSPIENNYFCQEIRLALTS